MPSKKKPAPEGKPVVEISNNKPPDRNDDGTLKEKPTYLTGRPKGRKNKLSRELTKVLADEQEGGMKFMKLLFKGAISDLENPNGTGKTFRVQLCAAFMLKTMPTLRQIDVESNSTFKGIFANYDNFIQWNPHQKEHFVKTGELPPAPEYAEEVDDE